MNQRIKQVQQRLGNWGIDALLIESSVDLFYLTGVLLSRGRLWIRSDSAQLHVDGRYFQAAQETASCRVFLWEKGQEPPQHGTIGFDRSATTVAGLEQLRKESCDATWVGITEPIMELRIIKEAQELKFLRQAAEITWAGIEHIRSLFRDGISEQELALEFEFFVRKKGASQMAFDPIIAFGEHSAHPHHHSSTTCLEKNQIVLVDVGAMVKHYCADVTRVFFFGKPDPRLQQMLELVREADRAARKQIGPHTKAGMLDRAARDVFQRADVEALFTHSLGHGLGLEPHERPTIRYDGEDREIAICPQMVVAIEPGLYQPGLGGVRYENSGVITASGFESFYPED